MGRAQDAIGQQANQSADSPFEFDASHTCEAANVENESVQQTCCSYWPPLIAPHFAPVLPSPSFCSTAETTRAEAAALVIGGSPGCAHPSTSKETGEPHQPSLAGEAGEEHETRTIPLDDPEAVDAEFEGAPVAVRFVPGSPPVPFRRRYRPMLCARTRQLEQRPIRSSQAQQAASVLPSPMPRLTYSTSRADESSRVHLFRKKQ